MIGAKRIREKLGPRFGEMVEDLRRIVSIDSPTFPGAGAAKVAAHFEERYRAIGGDVDRVPGTGGAGDHLTVRFRGARPEKPKVFLIGHCDTVFPEGTAAERPFTVDGDTGRGPGVVDMKGGLVTCLYAVDALMSEGFDDFGTIVILYDTDEERGNPSSRPLIEEIGEFAAAALILEPARADGSVVSARAGNSYGKLTVKGIAAHSGNDPEKGRSAVHELAHQIVRIYELARDGGTVNITDLTGGRRAGIVAEDASCRIEFRAWQQTMLDAMQSDMKRIIGRPALDGTSLGFEFLHGRPAMERTAETDELLAVAREVAGEAGVAFSHTETGGVADGNYLAPMRVPVLDGLGPVGGNLHTEEEYIELSSLVPRAAMLAGIIERVASGIRPESPGKT